MDGTVTEGQLLGGRYRVGSLLAEGGMAGVHDGYDTRLARPVAIKILRPGVAVHDAMRRRFEREARAAAGLSDPHVVAVYDSGEDDGIAYLVMERLSGETLADRIAAGPLPPEEVVTVAGDVLGALDAAHAIGLVHRDIKPGNILLTEDGHAKVADFGIAKSIEPPAGDATVAADLTQVGMVIGTPAYLAPERVAGRPATSYSDLYALGVVMYEAITGRKPLSGDSPAAVAEARRMAPPRSLAEVAPTTPAWLAAVVDKALAPRLEDRYPSARSMLADLRAGAVSADEAVTTALAETGAAAATVVAGEGTRLFAGGAGGAGGPGDPAAGVPTAEQPVVVARSPHRGQHRRSGSIGKWLAAAAALLAVVVVVVLLVVLLAGGHGNRHVKPPAAAPSTSAPASTTTTTAPSTTTATTADAVASALIQEAHALQAVGGSGRASLAQQLLNTASLPAGAQRAQTAQQTLYDARIFAERGEITSAEYSQVSALLQQAGATPISPPVYPTTPATVTPSTRPVVTTPATTARPVTTPATMPTPPATKPGHGNGHGDNGNG